MKLPRWIVRHGLALGALGVFLIIVGAGLAVFAPSQFGGWWYGQPSLLDGPFTASMNTFPGFGANIPAGTNISITVKVPSSNSGYFFLSAIYVYNSSGYKTAKLGGCQPSYCAFKTVPAKVNATEWTFIGKNGTYYFGFGGSVSYYSSGSPTPTGAFVVYGQTLQYYQVDWIRIGTIVSAVGAVVVFLGSAPALSGRRRLAPQKTPVGGVKLKASSASQHKTHSSLRHHLTRRTIDA
jgi:uncharacterized membrane protein